jgi:hypothetical protein
MITKLRPDDSLIRQAKKHTQNEGKSISQIVGDFFKAMQDNANCKKQPVGPITSKLHGCLRGSVLNTGRQ